MRFIIFGLLFLSAVYFSESYSIAKRDTKDDLLKSAENLRALAQKEIEKLKAEGKTLLATGLESADKLLIDLETQLKNLNPTTEVGKALLVTLETALKGAETKLEAEIKKLSGGFFADDLKDELLKQAENLKKLAADEIEKLKQQGKSALAAGLEKAEKFVLDLETQLQNLNPTTEVGKALLAGAEALLKKAETALEDEVKKLSSGLVKRDVQADLLKTITDLLTKAHTAVETLTKEGKTALVAGLDKSIKFLMDVETQLKNLHPTTELGKALLEGLENLIKQGEAALEADLKKANGGF